MSRPREKGEGPPFCSKQASERAKRQPAKLRTNAHKVCLCVVIKLTPGVSLCAKQAKEEETLDFKIIQTAFRYAERMQGKTIPEQCLTTGPNQSIN